jgi:hypothetical protein
MEKIWVLLGILGFFLLYEAHAKGHNLSTWKKFTNFDRVFDIIICIHSLFAESPRIYEADYSYLPSFANDPAVHR